ncbi:MULTISPECIES: CdaR family protein [Heyndrickxia]|uniref:CdaR family protein n=1 Tax=Heyndrickxia TaxID=2837504 RepID=UPI0003A1897B|nr:CdaR family protein [Heyndrickxia oleronia]GIN42237.1 CdaA regulatory protein CdaR [Heyndrickxia oleronia]
MDKFMDNKWFIRIVALFLALLLYVSVSIENNDKNKDVKQKVENDVVENMPVELIYDQQNFVVTGAPETVDVTIDGPKSLVKTTKNLKDFTVYIDLSNAEIGKQRVKLKYKDLSDKLTAKISPAYATVDVQEKVTKEFKVDAEFNTNLLASGFESESPIVDPKVVKITGAKNVIDQITYVKATIDAKKEINQTITRNAKVQVLDKSLNKLDVEVDQDTVEVTIPVKNPSKTVPITVNPIGDEKDGVVINSITTEPKSIKIYGRNDALKEINAISVDVDISKYDKDTGFDVHLKMPKGVNKIEPEVIRVKLNISDKEEEKTIRDIQVSSTGMNENYTMQFLSPANGMVDLTVMGTSNSLKAISANDFNILMDLSGLAPGDHDVNLKVEGPNDVSWELSNKTVKIRLTEKEDENI